MATSKTSENNIILIVVNSTKTLGVLVDYLKGYGFKVLVANDGESALTLLDYVKPDIILLDVLLPGIDGFETCRRLKSNEVTRDIPVIFITALANTLDKVRGFALGAVDYITKPIQSEEVLARLKTHVTMQSLQRTLAENNVRLQEGIAEQKKLIEELDAVKLEGLRAKKLAVSARDLDGAMQTIIHAGYASTTIMDHSILIEGTKAIEAPDDIARILVNAGTPPTHLAVVQENLEEYFLRLTN